MESMVGVRLSTLPLLAGAASTPRAQHAARNKSRRLFQIQEEKQEAWKSMEVKLRPLRRLGVFVGNQLQSEPGHHEY